MSQHNTNTQTSLEFAGIKFTGGKVMVILTALSTAGGGLWAGFEFYKDYTSMRDKITKYVAPDLSGLQQQIAVAKENTDKTVEYSQDIKNDLKIDIRSLESVVENLERSNREIRREVTDDIKEIRKDVDVSLKSINKDLLDIDKNITNKLKEFEISIDEKIQRALDNPLSNAN